MADGKPSLPNTACPDWATRLLRRQVPFNRARLPLRTDAAKTFGQVFGQLQVGDLSGEPELQALPNSAWVRDIGKAIWGGPVIREALICCPKKMAKALPLTTPVATPDGFTPLGALQVGDSVLAADGRPTRVLAKSPVFIGNPCFEVEFSTGEKIVADAEHRWWTSRHDDRQSQAGGRRRGDDAGTWAFRTTAELAEDVDAYRHPQGRYVIRQHRTAVAPALDLPHRTDLPVDPYLLGVWLGDGVTGSPTLTLGTVDADDIGTRIVANGGTLGRIRFDNPRETCIRASLSTYDQSSPLYGRFTGALRGLGVLTDKRIPATYLRGSRAQRLALLQGLLDSDGGVSAGSGTAPRVAITQARHGLAEDLRELVASLGFKPSMAERRARIAGRDCGPVWTVEFTAYREDAVFTLSRKNDRLRPRPAKPARSAYRQIVAVRPVPSRPTQCIKVASVTEQFLIGPALIPTGNTSFGALLFLAAFLLEKQPRQAFTILAPSIQIADIAFSACRAALEADPVLSKLCHIRAHVREIDNRSTGARLVVKAYTKSAATGLKGSVLIDEAWLLGEQAQAQKVHAQIKGALSANKSAKIVYVSTTSDDPPRGLWASLLSYARQVRDGDVIDPTFLPVIYEPWPGCPDPFEDESVWPCLLPSYPHIAGPEFYRSVIAAAKADGPAAISRDKAQFFNMTPRTPGGGVDGWIVGRMLPGLVERMTIADLIARADTITAGVDLGGLQDLSALTLLGVTDAGQWLVASRAWATDAAWQSPTSRSAFDDFVADGDLSRVQPGGDLPGILSTLATVHDSGKLAAVGVDPAGAVQLIEALAEVEGFEVTNDPAEAMKLQRVPVIGIGQSALHLSPALRSIERQAEQGLLRVADQRLLTWCLGNVRIVQRGAADAVDRTRTGDKIDAVAAMLDAVAAYIALPAPVVFDPLAYVG